MYHSTSCSINITMALEAIATKDTKGTMNVPGNYDWSLSAETLMADKAVAGSQTDTFELITSLLLGKELDIEMTTGVNGDILMSGKVFIETTGISADVGSSATSSFSFKGNGDLTVSRLAA